MSQAKLRAESIRDEAVPPKEEAEIRIASDFPPQWISDSAHFCRALATFRVTAAPIWTHAPNDYV